MPRARYKKRVLRGRSFQTSFAVVFPAKAQDGNYQGPLWVTRPSLSRKSKKPNQLRVVSVYPIVLGKKESPRYKWTVEMASCGTWMELLPNGYKLTFNGGMRVLQSLMKTNALSYRSVDGLTTLSKTGPELVSYRMFNEETGEEIVSDALQK